MGNIRKFSKRVVLLKLDHLTESQPLFFLEGGKTEPNEAFIEIGFETWTLTALPDNCEPEGWQKVENGLTGRILVSPALERDAIISFLSENRSSVRHLCLRWRKYRDYKGNKRGCLEGRVAHEIMRRLEAAASSTMCSHLTRYDLLPDGTLRARIPWKK